MKTYYWLTVFCFIAVVCLADDFYLRDHNGQVTGPFSARRGTAIQVGDQEYVISKVEKMDDDVWNAMERIVIPELNLRDVNITNAVEVLVRAGRENDPNKRGVDITLWPSSKDASLSVSNITLMAKNISLASAVRTVARSAGLKFHIMASVVRLTSLEEPQGELLQHAYPVEPSFVERIVENLCSRSNDIVNIDAQLKSYLEGVGVEWPRGSAITYDAIRSQLLVVNTAENMLVFDNLLASLDEGCGPPQVQIDMLLVEFDMTNLVHLAPDGINAKSLMRLWTNGCGRLLAAPRVVTRSGAEASIRGVKEIIYPTSFVELDGTWACVTNQLPPGASGTISPSDMATREVGAILAVLPEVSPDGRVINLTLQPNFIDLSLWKDYGYDVYDSGGKVRHMPNEQPIFYANSINTQISIADGVTVLLGGGMPTQDGKGIIYNFLTVRLVGPDGEPVRRSFGKP